MKDMEMTTMLLKWTRALSREGFTTTNLYFSELHKSSYYVKQILRPHYIAIITNYDSINEFSLATSTFDMSYPIWLVIFFYEGHGLDYCHSPPGNIFHLTFNTEMLVRCGTENTLSEWYSLDTNQTDIDYLATWNSDEGFVQRVSGSLYERRNNLRGSIIRVVTVKESQFINLNEDNELDGIFGILFKELSVALNFSYIISEVSGHGSWNKQENSWNEALNKIISGHADISLADFSMTSVRMNNFDFSLPIIIGENNLFFREPEKFTIKWSSYFRSSKDPQAKEIMKLMIEKENLPINLIDGFRKICDNHKLTLYSYYDMKRDIYFKMPCNVNYIKTGILENLAFILSKNYPFTGVINA
ncbi:PREDICTED: uncharacterized protein LOC107066062, partial [Polistes dominula]|uniref:Uncharacterized protein LOC107066062 n=1 Tax=Polistes dominula TaxID=743375 RepID=A0ABM1I6G6_POLDO